MDCTSSSCRYTRRAAVLATVLLVALAASVGGVQGAVCSQSQQSELSSLVDANKAVFQSCGADLKLTVASSATSDALAGFLTEDYLQGKNADAICASDNCVRALIRAMEYLPDCCTQIASSTRNLPRLADDILHQCDVRDAKLLASELEAEIAKLPDLKVQIKSLGTGQGNTVTGSGDFSGDGVDVIIDVKKRELMKAGGLGLTPNDSKGTSNEPVVATSNSAVDERVSRGAVLIAVVATIVQLLL
jgi:hypothetical protein